MHAAAERVSDRILVIDDTPSNVRLLERILASDGLFNVRSSTDPRQTVQLVDEFKPDLILLDLNMPHMDGYSILTALREQYGTSTPPVIVLTGDVSVGTMKRAFDAGASAVLTKPFERVELLARVRDLLRSSTKQRESAA